MPACDERLQSVEEHLEAKRFHEVPVCPGLPGSSLSIVVSGYQHQDGRGDARAPERCRDLDAALLGQREGEDDDVVIAGATELQGLLGIRCDVHDVARLTKTLYDESDDMGVFGYERLHRRTVSKPV